MTDNVIPFPAPSSPVDAPLANVAYLPDAERFDALRRHVADAMSLAVDLGSPREWTESAILHLKAQSSGHTDGGVDVSVAALHLVLGYVEYLEGRLGIIPTPGDAA